MTPPMIPPTMTDVMPLETESGTATPVSCVVAIDVLGVSGVVDFDVLPACGLAEISRHESSFSSVHINFHYNLELLIMSWYSITGDILT